MTIDLESLRGFTPGPWTANRQVNKHDESLGWIINGEGCRIGWSSYATAVPNEGEKAPHPIGEANARLIAAAPSMHAELTARRARDAEVEALVAEASKYADLSDALRDALAPFTGAKP